MKIPNELLKLSLPGENWAEIINPHYLVSNMGRVVSLYFKHIPRLHFMVQRKVAGYNRVHLRINGKSKLVSVHRLVALAFLPNHESLPEVNHIDGNKENNHVDNLEWVTKSQNKRHSIDVLHRPHPMKGKSLYNSYQHSEVVQFNNYGIEISKFYSIQVAALETGINATNISRCANGKRKTAGGYIWKFLKDL